MERLDGEWGWGGGGGGGGGGGYTSIVPRKYLSEDPLSTAITTLTEKFPNQGKIIQTFTKLPEYALNQSSVKNEWPIVLQSNTTQCFIVFQSWNDYSSFVYLIVKQWIIDCCLIWEQ